MQMNAKMVTERSAKNVRVANFLSLRVGSIYDVQIRNTARVGAFEIPCLRKSHQCTRYR
jgi:hypothetical protein